MTERFATRSSPSPPPALREPNDEEFRRYVSATYEGLKTKECNYFRSKAEDHDEVIRSACDAFCWCYSNMDTEERKTYTAEIQLGVDLLTTVSFLDLLGQRVSKDLPAGPQGKMLVTQLIKDNFSTAALLVDHLARVCPGDCGGFSWSKMKADFFDQISMKVTNTKLGSDDVDDDGFGVGICDTFNL